MFQTLKNAWKIPELKNKILFTLMIVILYRLGSNLPMPWVNPDALETMFGAGGNRPKDRRYEMGEVSGRLSDLSVITEDNSRFEDVMDIIEDIKVGINKTDGEYVVIPNRVDAIRYCIENAKTGDIIVLAGKGHEDYQEIRGVKYHMDEREIIAEIFDSLK